MRTKLVIAIFLLAIFALSTIATIRILPVRASGGSSNTLTLSDAELISSEFAKEWGPATITKTDLAGTGVQFDFTNLNPSSGTCVGDNFPVSQLAGGAWKTYGVTNPFSTWGDFSAYKRYSLCVENVGTEPVTVNLKLNSGWTTPPPEYAAGWRDTFWQDDWIYIGPGECKVVTLDFSSATVYNAMDEQEFTKYPDGTTGVAVWRTDEVSDIGFQVLGNGAGSIVVKGTQLYIDPPVTNKIPDDVCTTFDVIVKIQDISDLFGFDISVSWDNTVITYVSLDKTPLDTIWPQGHYETYWPPLTGPGWLKFVSVAQGGNGFTGSGTLFKITFHVERTCNFPLQTPIHFELVKLSDHLANSICAVLTDGMYYMSATVPDLEFKPVDPDPSKPFEYCKIFEVEVYATHICAHLKDYDITILFSSELLEFVDIDYWGTGLGSGEYSSTTGSVHVWKIADSHEVTGDEVLLFALTFHVKFDDRPEHIWRVNTPHSLTAQISIKDDVGKLSFLEGEIPISGVTLPPTLNIVIYLIQGDVDCDGNVDVMDLRTVAAFYDQTAPPAPAKYDLTNDGTIDIFDLVIIAANFGYTHDP